MLTLDTRIDRRIILEALSLQSDGRDVVVFGANDGTYPEHENYDGVKIFRPQFNWIDPRLKWLVALRNRLSTLISRFTNSVATLLGRYSFITTNIGQFSIMVINRICRTLLLKLPLLSGKDTYEAFFDKKIDAYRPDVVHAHDLPVLAAAISASRRNKAVCIYDSHELYTEEEFPRFTKMLYARKEKKCLKAVDWAITVNHFIHEELDKRYKIKRLTTIENCTLRPYGFDPTSHRYNLFRESPKFGLNSHHKLLLFQGGFAATRNLDTLIKGLSYLDSSYVLLMMGYGSYEDTLKQIAKKQKVDDRVIFVPPKNQNELLYYTASADLGLMPYTGRLNLNNLYSSPNKFYEFIAAGLPILANRLPYYEEVIGRFQNGIATELDTPEDFATGVERIFSMNLEQLRQRSLRAYNDLNWNRESEKLLAIYGALDEERQLNEE